MKRTLFHVFRAVREGRFIYLMTSLLLYLLLTPWLNELASVSVIYQAFMTVILATAVHAASETGLQRAAAAAIAAPTVIAIWIVEITDKWDFAAAILLLVFLGFIIYSLMKHIMKEKDVTRDIIFAAVSVYLIIGIFWSLLFALLEILEPGSFKGIDPTDSGQQPAFIHFSFVTLTTLGYGDITPATAKAGSLAMTEAIVGQIYMTVLVAWLVGLNVSRQVEKKLD